MEFNVPPKRVWCHSYSVYSVYGQKAPREGEGGGRPSLATTEHTRQKSSPSSCRWALQLIAKPIQEFGELFFFVSGSVCAFSAFSWRGCCNTANNSQPNINAQFTIKYTIHNKIKSIAQKQVTIKLHNSQQNINNSTQLHRKFRTITQTIHNKIKTITETIHNYLQ